MKKKLLIPIILFFLLVSSVNAYNDYWEQNTLDSSVSQSVEYGHRIVPLVNLSSVNVFKDSLVADDICELYSDAGSSLLANGTFSSDECVINYNMTNGTAYYLITNYTIGGSRNVRYESIPSTWPKLSNNSDFNLTHRVDYDGGIWTESTSTNMVNIYRIEATFADLPSSNFTISAYDVNGTQINNFSATINGTIYNTTTGIISTNIYNNDSLLWDFNVSATGYTTVSEINYNVTQNYQASMYHYNSVWVYAFDQVSGDVIEDFNVSLLSLDDYYFNSSNNNITIFDNLINNTYTANIISENYSDSSYIITVSTDSHQKLSAYLVSTNDTVIMTYLDEDTGAVLPGVSSSVSRIIDGSWTVVQSKQSDITGRVQFSYVPGINYKFTSSLMAYEEKVFYLDPVIFTSYNVKMSKAVNLENAPSYQGVSVVIDPEVYFNDQQNNFSLTFVSPDGLFTAYNYSISFPGGSYASSGSNAYGGAFSESLNITGAGWMDKVYLNYSFDTSIGIPKNYKRIYEIRDPSLDPGVFTDNQEEDYGLGSFERILVTLLVTIIVTGILSLLGGIILGAPIGLLVMGYLSFIGFMPLWAALPSFLVGFILIVARSS